ncbi:uncharacterized protein BCR38DRAFT_526516 [Pseudomassariella vexata]|uniref:Uncharacterized protein n=1 Tax=Pseudomassariella vexata TaxID=1141098 RepID=A0A1Y2DPI9_9PEZI|nr:uncharacterized protein BCR38DRAFT_526516 [Pseudomassariella vexata]ORY61026.1 hypothetical protein BCR38DRAFT_526516 [Pseudomassariella vexata]
MALPNDLNSKPESPANAGTALSDFLPVPHSTELVTNPGKQDVSTALADEPTLSHALAMDDHEEKGASQQDHAEEDVANLGWNETKDHIVNPLIGNLENEDLWLLIRRFNKQMYHVREVSHVVPGNLDLNIAYEEEFSPDKLRATIERLYMTVVIGLISVVKHLARLRSWRETRRTTAFCTAYFVAWTFDFITPLLAATVIALIIYPPVRAYLFPPAPISLVNSSSGGVQKPIAGVLGSVNSATGAPENHKGEAVEQEASNFFNAISSICITGATGKHPQSDPHTDENGPGNAVPDPAGIAMGAADAKDVAAGGTLSKQFDKTKVPIENLMWTQMRSVMHGIADISDTWERFANALSPTTPFPRDVARMRLATLVVPLLAISMFVTSYMFMKGMTLGAGLVFFGGPIFTRGIKLLDRNFPHWQKLLELRNTVLKGVPTNAQLTLTLLRVGEANKAPLPPPPRLSEAPPEQPVVVTDADLRATGAEPPLNATEAELELAMQCDTDISHENGDDDIDATKNSKQGRKGSRILGFFKSTTKGLVKSAIRADAMRAKAGSKPAKARLGAVMTANDNLTSGPIEFKARYKGHKGHVYISTKATIPAVAFSTDVTIEKVGTVDREDLHPGWSIAVSDIKELKKIGGYGWKAKIAVGWSLGREIADGLEITDRMGVVWEVTALPLRDELFNRLIAMGGQKWEACARMWAV